MRKKVAIYIDKGTKFETILRNVKRETDPTKVDIVPILAKEIIAGCLQAPIRSLIIPGGADLPYCRDLNGLGNRNIRSFVSSGGSYLGFCAGAYYACRELSFHAGRDDQVVGNRELALFEGIAIGSISEIGPRYDLTMDSASITNVSWQDIGNLKCYYHGGPYFQLDEQSDTKIIATYLARPNAPAVVESKFGNGKVILSGVHVETTACDIVEKLNQLPNRKSYKYLVKSMRDGENTRRLAFRNLLTRANIPLLAISSPEDESNHQLRTF